MKVDDATKQAILERMLAQLRNGSSGEEGQREAAQKMRNFIIAIARGKARSTEDLARLMEATKPLNEVRLLETDRGRIDHFEEDRKEVVDYILPSGSREDGRIARANELLRQIESISAGNAEDRGE